MLRSGVLAAMMAAVAPTANAASWNWSYAGSGFSASGELTTTDSPVIGGFYEVTGITGSRNGIAIAGLTPKGVPIPGNEPFSVDNLLGAGTAQLTTHGLGFSLADGNYVNLYFADFLFTPAYVEFFSAPPFVVGSPGQEDHELTLSSFSARQVVEGSVPEPASLALLLAGLGVVAVRRQAGARG